MDNRFEQLRYKNKMALNPDMSMNQLADKLGITTATVSRLEHDENYDARISIIKKYKEAFPDVSFDYLLGATYTKHKQYNRIEENLPFGNEFYDKLEYFFQEHLKRRDSSGELSDYMTMDNLGLIMEAFLQNPDALLNFFELLMDSLLYIRKEETNRLNYNDKKASDFYISGAKTQMSSEALNLIMTSVYPNITKMLDNVINEEEILEKEILEQLHHEIEPF